MNERINDAYKLVQKDFMNFLKLVNENVVNKLVKKDFQCYHL